MATGLFYGDLYEDAALRHGQVRKGDGRLYMTHWTFLAIEDAAMMGQVHDVMQQKPDGIHPLPGRMLGAGSREVQRGLEFAAREPSTVCVYPPCGQDAVVERDGFWLCAIHGEQLQDWDDLSA